MVQQRLSMRKVRDILRLRFEKGLSHSKIATALATGETTVGDCIKRAADAGITWPVPDNLDDETLEALLYNVTPNLSAALVMPDFAHVEKELRKKAVTLQLLWHEYKEAHGDRGYQYSQFCFHYRAHKKTVDLEFRNTYKAGEKCFVDYAGHTIPIYSPDDGSVRYAEIFIAVLGASNYTYVEASWSQDLPSWVGSHVRAFEFFGGSVEILVPDNLRSGVTKPCRYDPDITPAYYHMAAHYNCVVIPARQGKPRDKAKAENGVLVVERWILAKLRNFRFFGLYELNKQIKGLLPELNGREFNKMKGSRAQLFEDLDRPALKPLPGSSYEYVVFSRPKVNINYHVPAEDAFYSVPHTLVGKVVEVRVGESVVEILHNNQRVASHPRSRIVGHYETLPEHMPRKHQEHVAWTPERITRWAAEAGPATGKCAEIILASKPHPEQAYNAILGLIRLGKRHGQDRLEAACVRALEINCVRYRKIKDLVIGEVKKPTKAAQTDKPTPPHANVRGRDYYN